ncbi:MAG: hypothetical protein ACR2PR_01490 [Pseudohongiellaceae bacterium]
MKNLDGMKEQLEELAIVVNNFKSEAVQLRVLEFLLDIESETSRGASEPTTKRRVSRKKATKVTPRKSTNNGPVATLTQLLEDGFFSKPRTITDITQHCEQDMAKKFKSSAISGKLTKLVRAGKLKRTKNSNKKYEYTSK